MQPIHSISEAGLRPYIGSPVCCIRTDGTYVFGHVNRCEGGQLHLDQAFDGPGNLPTNVYAAQAKLKSNLKKKAKVSYYPYGYGYGFGFAAVALSLAAIAAIVAFPFGFFFL
ncbi:hypothetical protein [Marinicrinis sediminis]|uniref:Uncharacterized protein n=1 Tax=Marinicrinis sediminis TaxID=1652465 RepID=A0ABW5REX6_9BACL